MAEITNFARHIPDPWKKAMQVLLDTSMLQNHYEVPGEYPDWVCKQCIGDACHLDGMENVLAGVNEELLIEQECNVCGKVTKVIPKYLITEKPNFYRPEFKRYYVSKKIKDYC